MIKFLKNKWKLALGLNKSSTPKPSTQRKESFDIFDSDESQGGFIKPSKPAPKAPPNLPKILGKTEDGHFIYEELISDPSQKLFLEHEAMDFLESVAKNNCDVPEDEWKNILFIDKLTEKINLVSKSDDEGIQIRNKELFEATKKEIERIEEQKSNPKTVNIKNVEDIPTENISTNACEETAKVMKLILDGNRINGGVYQTETKNYKWDISTPEDIERENNSPEEIQKEEADKKFLEEAKELVEQLVLDSSLSPEEALDKLKDFLGTVIDETISTEDISDLSQTSIDEMIEKFDKTEKEINVKWSEFRKNDAILQKQYGPELLNETYLQFLESQNPQKSLVPKESDEIYSLIDLYIENHPEIWEEIVDGNEKLIGKIVSFVMKEMKGISDPKFVNSVIHSKIQKTNRDYFEAGPSLQKDPIISLDPKESDATVKSTDGETKP